MSERINITITPAFRAMLEDYAAARGYTSLSRATTELAHIALREWRNGNLNLIDPHSLEHIAPPHGGKRAGAGRKSSTSS